MFFPVACCDINIGTAGTRDLNADMAGRSKPVDAEACAIPLINAGEFQRSITDDARTQQRRSLEVIKTVRYGINKIRICDNIFCKAAILRPTRKLCVLTKILPR